MEKLFLITMIISIFAIYFTGNIYKSLRNVLALVIAVYSFMYFIGQTNFAFTLNILGISDLIILFKFTHFGYIFNILNHLCFIAYIAFEFMTNERKNDSSYFMNMFFILLSANLLFYSGNMFTFVVMWEILFFFLYFIITMNSNDESIGDDILFSNSLSAILLIISVLLIRITGIASNNLNIFISVILFITASYIKALIIPMNRRFSESVRRMSSLFIGYFITVVNCAGLFSLIFIFSSQAANISKIQLIVIRNIFSLVGIAIFLLFSLKSLSSRDMKQIIMNYSVAMFALSSSVFFINSEVTYFAMIVYYISIILPLTMLFIEINNIEKYTGESDLMRITGMRKLLKFSLFVSAASFLTLSGIFPTFGFVNSYMFSLSENGFIKLYNSIISLIVMFFTITIGYKFISLTYFENTQIKIFRKNAQTFDYSYLFKLIAAGISVIMVSSSLSPELSGLFFKLIMNGDNMSNNGIIVQSIFNLSIMSYINTLILLSIPLINLYFLKIKSKSSPYIYISQMDPELLYNEKGNTPRIDSIININSLNFYGKFEENIRIDVSKYDIDRYLNSARKLITDFSNIFTKLYQRSISSVIAITILFLLLYIVIMEINL